MDKQEKQVRKVPECEACKERNKIVDDVINKIEESEPKKKTLFEFFESINKYHNSTITFKIEITWPKDM